MEDWKIKTESVKKKQFLKEWEQLKFQVKTIERENNTGILIKRSESRKKYSEIEEMERVLNEEIKKEAMKINQHFLKIKHKLKNFHLQLSNVQSQPQFLENLRGLMEDIETSINLFKENQRKMFEVLLNDEATIQHDIEIIKLRIDNIMSSNSVAPATGSKVVKIVKESAGNLPPEVTAFEKFVAQHGMQGGWDDYDHGTFIKIRSKFKGNNYFESALGSLPGRRLDDLKQHEEWYKTFLNMKQAKKRAITNWKLNKEMEQKENTLEIPTPEEIERNAELKREKEKLEKQERERQKRELEEWKTQKAEQAREEAHKKKEIELIKQKLKEKEQNKLSGVRAAARERIKEKKEERERVKWKEEKEWEEMKEMRNQQALQEIARFQQRDQMNLKLKEIDKRRKDEEERIRLRRLERTKREVKVEAKSDRNRLYQPTNAWIERQRQNEPETQGPMLHVPHRAVPNWRQGI